MFLVHALFEQGRDARSLGLRALDNDGVVALVDDAGARPPLVQRDLLKQADQRAVHQRGGRALDGEVDDLVGRLAVEEVPAPAAHVLDDEALATVRLDLSRPAVLELGRTLEPVVAHHPDAPQRKFRVREIGYPITDRLLRLGVDRRQLRLLD